MVRKIAVVTFLTFKNRTKTYLPALMTVEQIETWLRKEPIPKDKIIRFELKKRNPVRGLIVEGRDHNELKAKNFWRIVTQSRLADYQKTKDINLARIFSGSDFAKLSFVPNKAEE
jgi:hypothetical protein